MKKLFVLLFLFVSICIADEKPLSKEYIECDKLAPHGLQTTTCLFGGGGLMLLGLSILSYSLDPYRKRRYSHLYRLWEYGA